VNHGARSRANQEWPDGRVQRARTDEERTGAIESGPTSEWLSPKVEVRPSPINGTGLFAIDFIQKGEQISRSSDDYVIMTDVEFDEYVRTVDSWDSVSLGDGRNKVWLQGREVNRSNFANHSCDPNAEPNEDGLTAKRGIDPDQEITVDYVPISRKGWSLRCNCGSANCRGVVHGAL
jgi:uncharacterized protein